MASDTGRQAQLRLKFGLRFSSTALTASCDCAVALMMEVAWPCDSWVYIDASSMAW